MAPFIAAFVDAVPLPALVIRRDESIEAANPQARSLLGPGIVGRHFITALRQPQLLDAIEHSLRDSAPRAADYMGNDGRQDTTFRVAVRPVELPSGAGVLVSFEDVTHAEQLLQMRRDFVANVSHELKTPLTALIGFIETLKGPARNDPVGQARFLNIMEAEAHRMNRLVSDLLSLSRVEADERVRPTERIDLGASIMATINGLSPLAQEAEVTLVHDLPDTQVVVPADRDQLHQVLTNLIENAIKYCGKGTTVTVRLGVPNYAPGLRAQAATLIIQDNGPGIDPIHLPRLTERFYRIDTHRSREMGGTGLGLAIVKHIVNRHRGRLKIQSEQGVGTRFTITLPVS
ncbi:sensor histidine kinase [Antarctobacter heliothermus]|uniref:histidine kinase n=1 Tax=Antarctobacter heliothermus TaxID=74033 RepID=A0A239FNL3_9RHOB|nr:ATP-binding protein [Antarctobacter heliothermus]SNS57823.1 two-component system, OmpR family, phosphate regulon sensor histidine kinase PhoR [Antarctobacter heliothermus]